MRESNVRGPQTVKLTCPSRTAECTNEVRPLPDPTAWIQGTFRGMWASLDADKLAIKKVNKV